MSGTTEVSRLVLAVEHGGVKQARDELGRFAKAGGEAETSAQRLEGAASKMNDAFRKVASALGLVSAGAIAQRVIALADEYNTLNARLGLVARSTADFAAAQEQLFRIAQQSGTRLATTVDLYGSLARNTEALGISQQRTLGVTQAITQAIAVSGGSAQSAQAALVQLGQGFASGVLRGEELNSVLEQTPRLARAIADGLGVSVGQLRQLGQDGELTAEKVFGAIEKAAKQLQAEFDALPLTVARATTEQANALQKLVGEIDRASGATQALAEHMHETAITLSEVADEVKRGSQGAQDIGLMAETILVVIETFRVLGANVLFVLKAMGREIGAILSQAAALARLDISGFRAISDAVREDAARARAELDALEARILRRAPAPGDPRADRGVMPGDRGWFTERTAPAAPTKKAALSDAERYLDNLDRQVERSLELTAVEQVLYDLQTGRLKLTNGVTKEQLLLRAEIVDRLKEEAKWQEAVNKAAQEAAAARKKEYEQAVDAANANMRADADRLRNILARTPQGRADQLAKDIDFLQRQLEDVVEVGADGEATVIKRATLTLDQYAEAVKIVAGFNEQATHSKSLFEEMGATFESAFEKAVVGGESLSKVLKALDKDIATILLRRLVTEPLGDGLSSFLKGGSFLDAFGAKASSNGGGLTNLLGGLLGAFTGGGYAAFDTSGAGSIVDAVVRGTRGGAATGSNYIQRDMLTILHKGEAVIPAAYNPSALGGGPVFNQTFVVQAAPDRRTQKELMASAARGASLALGRG